MFNAAIEKMPRKGIRKDMSGLCLGHMPPRAGKGNIKPSIGWKCGIPSCALATFVAFSRVHVKQLFVHDVMTGAVIGIQRLACSTGY